MYWNNNYYLVLKNIIIDLHQTRIEINIKSFDGKNIMLYKYHYSPYVIMFLQEQLVT